MSGIWGFFGDFWVFHENICFFVKCGTFMSSFRIPYLKFCLLENWGIYWKIPTQLWNLKGIDFYFKLATLLFCNLLNNNYAYDLGMCGKTRLKQQRNKAMFNHSAGRIPAQVSN